MTRRPESLRAGTAMLFGAQLFYKATGFLVYLVLGHWMDPADVGRYFFASSVCATAMVIANLNVNPLLTRRLAAGAKPTATTVGEVLGFRLALAPLYLAAITVFAAVFRRADFWVLLVTAVFALAEDLYYTFGAIFVALRRIRYNVAIGTATQALFVASLAIGLAWRPALDTLLGANLLRSALLLVAAAGLTHARISPLRPARGAGWAREALPFIALAVFSVLADQTDTLLLGAEVDYHALASYGYALRTVWALLFIPQVVGQVFYPRLVAGGLAGEDGRHFWPALAAVAGAGVAAALGAALFAGPLCRVLYPTSAVPTARLLAAMSPFIALALPGQLILRILPALGQERRALAAVVTGALVLAIGDLLALPRWGVAAAPWVRALACAAQLAVAGAGLRRATK